MSPRGISRLCSLALVTLLASTLISGCGMGTPAAPSAGALSGRAIGGNFPIVGGRVYLFAASNVTYGAASISLLANDPVSAPDVQTDGNGNTYVLTGAGGNFNVTGEYACNNTTDQVYVLIAGGNPGLSDPSTDNEALALMAALGPCGFFNGSSTLTLNPSTFVNVNEVTTVAAVYALSQFMTDATHIGTNGFNLSGLANAFATASNLATNSTGSANTTFDQTALGVTKTVTAPHDEIDYLANALVPCVNSDGGGDSPCPDLYTASGNTAAGNTPTDTVQAMLAIARAPAAHEHLIWELPSGIGSPPFATSLTEPTPPATWDWSLVLTYTGGNNDGQQAVLDANGALWSVAFDTSGNSFITGISNNGTPLTSPTGLYNSFPLQIAGIAFDTHNNLWLDESDAQGDGDSDLQEIDASSGIALQTVSGPGTNLDQPNSDPASIIIDGNNNIWLWMVADAPFLSTPGSINMLQSGNNYLAGPGFPSTNGGFNNDYNLIVDGGSNLFASGQINPGIAGIASDGTGIGGAPFASTFSVSSMALDGNGNICFVGFDPNVAGFDVYRTALGSGGVISPPLGDPSEPVEPQSGVQSVLVDGNNNLWLTMGNGLKSQLDEIDSTNTILESIGTTTNTSPTGLAIITNDDSSGNLWLSSQDMNTGIYTIYEYVGIAGPVQTPVSKQIVFGSIGKFPGIYGI